MPHSPLLEGAQGEGTFGAAALTMSPARMHEIGHGLNLGNHFGEGPL